MCKGSSCLPAGLNLIRYTEQPAALLCWLCVRRGSSGVLMQPWAVGGYLQAHSLTFSEALANLEPVELKARAARGPSWAGMAQAVFCRAQGNVSAKGHAAPWTVRAGHSCLAPYPHLLIWIHGIIMC